MDGLLHVSVTDDYGAGHTAVTFEYDEARNKGEFQFDYDGCGIQPDLVTGVRYVVEQGQPAPDRAWVTRSFTWETESGDLTACA